MNTGRNGTHSCLFNPSLKPTHSKIPYQDIIQVVAKNEYYFSFLHKNYTQLVFQLLPFFCLLFALSTLGVAIKAQGVFPPQRKIAGSRKCDLPWCTMDVRICLMRQLPVRYYAYGTIGVAHVSDWSTPKFQEDPIAVPVGTLKDGYVSNVPLPRAPRIQSASHVTSHGAVTCDEATPLNSTSNEQVVMDSRHTCYLQVPRVPTWSNLTRLLIGVRRNVLPFCLLG